MDASTFPLSFQYHLVFAVVAAIFFLVQYVRLKRPYQLILVVAFPASLLIYVNPESKVWFQSVGWFEFALLVGAVLVSIVARQNEKKKQKAVSSAGAAAASETTEQSATEEKDA
jgi:glycerol-3-phosphate acyltransferase PlsY